MDIEFFTLVSLTQQKMVEFCCLKKKIPGKSSQHGQRGGGGGQDGAHCNVRSI
jgi:hypothetical protein